MGEFWEKLKRVDAVSNEGRMIFLVMIMAGATVLSLVEAVLLRSWAPLGAAGLGWAFVVLYSLLQSTALEKGGGAVGAMLVPSGSTTPSVAQHSNIEAMEVRGEYEKAAKAYRDVIASSPEDIVACEKLGQLAMRQLKDYETAVWAYRQAEQRMTEPRRKLGYALIIAGLYRDNLQDNGKAIVELRKVLERYPDAPNAARLKTELDELKAKHFEGA